MRRLWVSVFVLALVLVVTSGPAFATHSPSALQEVVGVDKTGALYALFLPHGWNGRLVVYAHGFVDPAAPVALPDSAPVDVAPWVVELRESLLQAGYAVAYSSYAENGWAVGDGAERTHELRPLFAKHFGEPQDTYIVGRSLGGLITMLLVHTHPHEYSGALALCGPVGGARQQVDYVANTRVLFDFFFPGVIPGDVLDVPELEYSSYSPLVRAIVGAILANPQAAVALASVAQVELPWTNFPELVNSIVRVLGYNIRGTNDLLARTRGHSPFDNRRDTYSGLGAFDTVLNAAVERYAADKAGLDFLGHFYQPEQHDLHKHLKIPVLTLHTTLDPDVPFAHEQTLAAIVTKANESKWLAQEHYVRYGHCNFSPAEATSAFGRLVNWAETGVKPASGAVAP